MGLFENLGRKVESFKQDATENASAPTHRCGDCDAEFFTPYETCPDCEGEDVHAIE
ncbi:PhlB family protein [Halorhabdus amylolytica]|uniref:hypothetical protein n=1 Tax=Halorhabdus amylolytica TaxID=2559573 RepID=UPI00145BC1DC|nr:hypothetical protein [Halorhabdus amylolytica]